MPARRFLPSMRRSREARVGLVGRRLIGATAARRIEIEETIERVLPVARLGAVTLRDDDQNAVAGQPRAGEPFQPRAHVGRAATANAARRSEAAPRSKAY